MNIQQQRMWQINSGIYLKQADSTYKFIKKGLGPLEI